MYVACIYISSAEHLTISGDDIVLKGKTVIACGYTISPTRGIQLIRRLNYQPAVIGLDSICSDGYKTLVSNLPPKDVPTVFHSMLLSSAPNVEADFTCLRLRNLAK